MLYRHFRTTSAIALILALPASLSAQSQTETHSYDELGRLIVTTTSGGLNNGDTRSYCFDEEGNRQELKFTSNGTTANCVAPTPQTPPPPNSGSSAPTPTPTPTNTPPVAVNNSVSGLCWNVTTVNLTANDSDAEDAPAKPVLVSISNGAGGQASATIASSSSVYVDFGPLWDITTFTYTVQDSDGAQDSATLSVATSSCGNGGMPP